MKISNAFPSKWLKVEDLNKKDVTVVIDHVQMEDMGSGENAEEKPVVYFMGAKKGLALNKTNAQTVAMFHGDDTDHWHGKKIILYPAMTSFQGRMVPCIRVRGVSEEGPPLPQAEPTQASKANPFGDPLPGDPDDQEPPF